MAARSSGKSGREALMWILAFLLIIAAGVLGGAWRMCQSRSGPRALFLPLTVPEEAAQHAAALWFVSFYPDGLRFRMLGEAHWTFGDIASVDARFISDGVSLIFSAYHRQPAIEVFVPDAQSASRMLQTLPAVVALSSRAAALRNWSTIPA